LAARGRAPDGATVDRILHHAPVSFDCRLSEREEKGEAISQNNVQEAYAVSALEGKRPTKGVLKPM
jgi:hypothetical protein